MSSYDLFYVIYMIEISLFDHLHHFENQISIVNFCQKDVETVLYLVNAFDPILFSIRLVYSSVVIVTFLFYDILIILIYLMRSPFFPNLT